MAVKPWLKLNGVDPQDVETLYPYTRRLRLSFANHLNLAIVKNSYKAP